MKICRKPCVAHYTYTYALRLRTKNNELSLLVLSYFFEYIILIN